MLLRGAPDAVEARRGRLADAISGFDAATIETTHGFCQKVLDELGTLGRSRPDVTLRRQRRRPRSRGRRRPLRAALLSRPRRARSMSRQEAGRVARIAIDNPLAPIYPLAPRDRPATRDALPAGAGGARRARAAQAPARADDLRRPADATAGHARRARNGAGRDREAARPLPLRADRRVPGHRPDPVGDRRARVRRRRR